MTTTVTAHEIGEIFVAHWLRHQGYVTNIESKSPDCSPIEARGSTKTLLVQVKSAVFPDSPDSLSPEEESRMIDHAAQLGSEAWEARIQLDEQLNQVGQPVWRRLN